jgi:hypothetical protein
LPGIARSSTALFDRKSERLSQFAKHISEYLSETGTPETTEHRRYSYLGMTLSQILHSQVLDFLLANNYRAFEMCLYRAKSVRKSCTGFSENRSKSRESHFF